MLAYVKKVCVVGCVKKKSVAALYLGHVGARKTTYGNPLSTWESHDAKLYRRGFYKRCQRGSSTKKIRCGLLVTSNFFTVTDDALSRFPGHDCIS